MIVHQGFVGVCTEGWRILERQVDIRLSMILYVCTSYCLYKYLMRQLHSM